MKTNGTLLTKRLFISAILLISFLPGFSQPDYVFKNPTLVSGTDRTVGAQYLFQNVKLGVDAYVTIKSLSPGISIATFDDNANGGFDEAFQPRITAAGRTTGYAEFDFDFVLANTKIPLPQVNIPATSIDVDGSGTKTTGLHEVDEYMTPGLYFVDYDMVGTDLEIIFGAVSVIGRNTMGAEKVLIDTVAREAMFTVNYVATSAFTARIGLENHNNSSTTRQRSVYFQRFFFMNSFLPTNNLTSFTGNRPKNDVVVLNWKMNTQHQFTIATIERSSNGTSFESIAQLAMQGKNISTYTDNTAGSNSNFYRLKMTDNTGKITYSSVVYLKADTKGEKMNVFPSMVTADYTNVSYKTERAAVAKVALYDQSGRMMLTQDVMLAAGSNTIALNGLSRFNKGQYVVMVSGQDFRHAQQIQINR